MEMSTTDHGLMNQSWLIAGFEGTTKIFQKIIPLEAADEAEIVAMLKNLASQHLTKAEIQGSEQTGVLDVLRDDPSGALLSWSCGQNPRYVASLWPNELLAIGS
jgi:hypothetical protein